MESNFLLDPLELRLDDGIEIEIYHSSEQKDLIRIYANQYGTDVIGLSRIVLRANMNRLYRSSRRRDSGESFEALNSTYNKRNNLKLIA